MRLANMEDAIDNLSNQVALLGGRIESPDSIFHFERMNTMKEFDNVNKQLKDDEEFRKLTVSLLIILLFFSCNI